MTLFNNREIATAIWLLVTLVFALSKHPIRKSMLDVVKTLFQPKLLFCIGFMILYTASLVAALNAANFWTMSLLKDTILWFCFAGVVLAFRFVMATNNVNVFSTIVVDNIKVILVFEFFINTYTFSLPVELVIIPCLSLLAIVDVVASTDEKH